MEKNTSINCKSSNYIFAHIVSDICHVDVHIHDSYEIFQACSDNIRYFIEGNAYDLKAGDLIITNTKEIHRPTLIDNNDYDRRFIQFNPGIFTPLFDANYNPLVTFEARTSGIGNRISFDTKGIDEVTTLLDQFEELCQTSSPENQLLGQSLIIQLLIKINGLYNKFTESPPLAFTMDPRIIKVKEQLDTTYYHPFNLDELSKTHFMDKYYLSHLYKKNTGFTIYEYVQTKRIQLAKQLIQKGIPISEASQLCGFIDYSNFYKTFKKLVKCSPKAYKDHISKK